MCEPLVKVEGSRGVKGKKKGGRLRDSRLEKGGKKKAGCCHTFGSWTTSPRPDTIVGKGKKKKAIYLEKCLFPGEGNPTQTVKWGRGTSGKGKGAKDGSVLRGWHLIIRISGDQFTGKNEQSEGRVVFKKLLLHKNATPASFVTA